MKYKPLEKPLRRDCNKCGKGDASPFRTGTLPHLRQLPKSTTIDWKSHNNKITRLAVLADEQRPQICKETAPPLIQQLCLHLLLSPFPEYEFDIIAKGNVPKMCSKKVLLP